MTTNPWVPLPTRWIEEGGLQKFTWGSDGEGANHIVALMILVAIAHHADDEGVAKLTYDTLCAITTRSRAKVSCGLTILETFGIVEREPCGQSSYKLTNYSKQNGWGKLPARNLYASDYISVFNEFQLRKRVELNALKLYLLFVARRDRKTNMAHITYKNIAKYAGLKKNDIKSVY